MISDLKKKIKTIIRRYMESGNADKLNTDGFVEVQRAIKKYGAESISKSELKPIMSEVTNEMQDEFTSTHLGELSGETNRAMSTIIDASTQDAKKIDRSIFNGVVKGINAGLTGDFDWRDISRAALRKLNLAEHHIETNINTAQAALDNASRAEQFKSGDVAYLRYAGPTGTKRPFCMEHIGKVYPLSVVEQMLNGFGQKAIYYCGGWNCRHRWDAVNKGTVTIEDGRKSKQHELDTAQALSNAGYDVVLKKESTVEGTRSFEGYVNGTKAEFKNITNATTNERNRVKLNYQEAIKQGGEHLVIDLTKDVVEMDEINVGLQRAMKLDVAKKITKITIIHDGAIQTITREDYEKGEYLFR
jgi:hypothetical protein